MASPFLRAAQRVIDTFWRVRNLGRAPQQEPTQRRHVTIPGRTSAGVWVDHDTALKYSAVFACVRIIGETVAALPWHVHERQPNGDRTRRADHPVENLLLRRPNPEISAFDFKLTLMAHVLTWGNGYAEIERDRVGRPVALWGLLPDRTRPARKDGNGRLIYEYTATGGKMIELEARDVFHVKGLGFDGLVGYSVITMAARSIGAGIAVEEYAASFFGNATTPSGVLEHQGELSPPAQERLKDQWEERHRGPSKAHRPIILEEGMKWQAISIPPENAQFIESRNFSVRELARWYRVPPHKLADLERATFTNIEHQDIEFGRDVATPWSVRLEQEADAKLFLPRERALFTNIALAGIMRGDTKARAEWYKTMWGLGVFSINEIRAFEDLNGIGPDGDKRFVQLNLTTIEKAGEEPPQPRPAPAAPDQNDDGAQERQNDLERLNRALTSYRTQIRDATERLLAGEQRALQRMADSGGDGRRIDLFLGRRLEMIRTQLTPPLQALAAELAGAQSNGAMADTVSTIVDLAAADHIRRSATDMKRFLNDTDRYADQIDERAALVAENLATRITAIATIPEMTQ